MKKMQVFIFIIALFCFLGSGGYLAKYFWERHVSVQNMDAVKELLDNESYEDETILDENNKAILVRYAKLKEENRDSEYTEADQIGKTGIEKEYESYLHGARGYEKITVNQSGRVLDVTDKKKASSGNDIYLTIDSNIQRFAESAVNNIVDE